MIPTGEQTAELEEPTLTAGGIMHLIAWCRRFNYDGNRAQENDVRVTVRPAPCSCARPPPECPRSRCLWARRHIRRASPAIVVDVIAVEYPGSPPQVDVSLTPCAARTKSVLLEEEPRASAIQVGPRGPRTSDPE